MAAWVVPVLEAAASIGGRLYQSGPSDIVGRIVGYCLNQATPILIPSVEDLMKLGYNGQVDNNKMRRLLELQGIPRGDSVGSARLGQLWGKVIEANRPRLSVDQAIDAYGQGLFTFSELNANLDMHGMSNARERAFLRDQAFKLPVDLIFRWHAWGIIDDAKLEEYLKIAGFGLPELLAGINRDSVPFNSVDLVQLRNRGVISQDEFWAHLKAAGTRNAGDQGSLNSLRYQIPGASDLIRFAVKDIYQADIVARFGYDDEFPAEFRYWMEKAGYVYTKADIKMMDAPRNDIDWARDFWRAHWDNMSPTQGYVALHRCRGNPNDPSTWRIPGVMPFTANDMDLLLKIADYPAIQRQWLTACSYRTPRLVDIERMLQESIVDNSEAKELYQDLGYTEVQAARMANLASARVRKRAMTGRNKSLTRSIMESFRLGINTEDETYVLLFDLYDLNATLTSGFKATTAAEKVFVAKANADIVALVTDTKARDAVSKVSKRVRMVKRAYIGGHFTTTEATDMLTNMGISPLAANDYIADWNLERMGPTREVTVAQITEGVIRGIIVMSDASKRLYNLGYSDADVTMILGLIAERVNDATAKATMKAATTAKQAAAAARTVLVNAQRDADRARAVMLRTGTIAQLTRWAKRGLLTRVQAATRMVGLGMEPADADRQLTAAGVP